MSAKVRKEIYIEPEQDALLKKLAEDTGMSESEVIGQAIEMCVQSANTQPQPADLSAWAKELEFILEWAKQGPVSGGRTWEREDAYDREIFRRY